MILVDIINLKRKTINPYQRLYWLEFAHRESCEVIVGAE